MYPNLKLQIFKRGVRQNHLAKQIGISDPILSKIIHGYREPSEAERKLLAACLEADEGWLFERFESAAPPVAPPLRTGNGDSFPDRH
jgi:transcriptional regulator with XRE-family HTH domain